MSADAWITLAVVVIMLAALAREILPPAATVLGATVTLMILGVIDEGQAFSGFSNSAPLTVAALYVLARAADKTGLLGPVLASLLGKSKTIGSKALARLLGPVALASGFVNNTPLVGMLIPEITAWSQRRGVSPSRLLLPLSYAAILGGTITVIGTSTNLVVSGLMVERGMEPLGLFEITPIGGLVALSGLIVLVLLIPRLLPERKAVGETLADEIREFGMEMIVDEGGKLDGVSIEDASLRSLEGVYLVEIQRDDETISAPSPDTELMGGDRLVFVGKVDLIVDLQRKTGLSSTEDEHLMAVDSPQHTFFEAVIGADSPLNGNTLADRDFRARYQAAVVSIHRAGERINAKLGQVKLRSGDTLLLLASPDFRVRWRERRDFLLIAPLGGSSPSMGKKAPIVGITAIAVIALAAFEILPIFHAALLAVAVMIATRVLSIGEARDSVDLDVIVLIAASFGVGAAIDSTGLAATLADGLVNTLGQFGDIGIVLGLVLATTILTEIITNNAAAAVLLPIALAVAFATGLDPRIIAIAIAVTASSSFLTPLGYQTNTMVYGPGGYHFTDYIRAGLPLNIVVVTVITVMTMILAT